MQKRNDNKELIKSTICSQNLKHINLSTVETQSPTERTIL